MSDRRHTETAEKQSDDGKTVPIGQAVQFLVAGGTANIEYTIRVTATTNSTPAQILVGGVILDVVIDPA